MFNKNTYELILFKVNVFFSTVYYYVFIYVPSRIILMWPLSVIPNLNRWKQKLESLFYCLVSVLKVPRDRNQVHSLKLKKLKNKKTWDLMWIIFCFTGFFNLFNLFKYLLFIYLFTYYLFIYILISCTYLCHQYNHITH